MLLTLSSNAYISLLLLSLLGLLGLSRLIGAHLLLLYLRFCLVLVDLDHVLVHQDVGQAHLLRNEFAALAPKCQQ
jgi:hypothetical protein